MELTELLSREAPKLGMVTHTVPSAVGGGGSKTTSQSRLYRKALSQEPNNQPVNSKNSGNLLMIRKTMEKKIKYWQGYLTLKLGGKIKMRVKITKTILSS